MRKYTALLLGAALMLAAGGCGAETPPEQTQSTSAPEQIELTWWSFPIFVQENSTDAGGTYEQSLIDAFEALHPEITVKLKMIDFTSGPEQIGVALDNGTMGDVLFDAPGRIIAYGKAGKLADLGDLFTDEFRQDIENDAILEACMDGTTAYMYPLSSAPFYMAFNKAYLEKAGVAERVREGWTTDDFCQVMQALREKGYAAGSLFCKDAGGDQATRALVANLYSSSITDSALSRYTIGEDAGIQGMELLSRMVEEGWLLNGTMYNGSEDIAHFAGGKTSMTILWSPELQKANQATLDANQVETVEVPLPSDDGIPTLEYLVNGFCVFDNDDAAKIAASKTFLRFLCDDPTYGPHNVVHTGSFPVRSSYGALYDDARMERISGWTKYYGAYYNTIDGFSEMRVSWYHMLQKVLEQDLTPRQAVGEFVEAADQTIE